MADPAADPTPADPPPDDTGPPPETRRRRGRGGCGMAAAAVVVLVLLVNFVPFRVRTIYHSLDDGSYVVCDTIYYVYPLYRESRERTLTDYLPSVPDADRRYVRQRGWTTYHVLGQPILFACGHSPWYAFCDEALTIIVEEPIDTEGTEEKIRERLSALQDRYRREYADELLIAQRDKKGRVRGFAPAPERAAER